MWRTSVVFILPLIQVGLMGSYVLCGSSDEGSYPAPGFIMFEFGTSAEKTRHRPQQGHSNAEHPAAPKAYRKEARCIENASTLNFQVPFSFSSSLRTSHIHCRKSERTQAHQTPNFTQASGLLEPLWRGRLRPRIILDLSRPEHRVLLSESRMFPSVI